jgi:hypothetical protein
MQAVTRRAHKTAAMPAEGQMLKEIRELFRGKVVAGHDLDVF